MDERLVNEELGKKWSWPIRSAISRHFPKETEKPRESHKGGDPVEFLARNRLHTVSEHHCYANLITFYTTE